MKNTKITQFQTHTTNEKIKNNENTESKERTI